MDWRKIIAALLVILAGWNGIKDGGGSNPKVTKDTAGIAEGIHRDRAKRQADIYRSVADAVDAGTYADGSALGRDVVAKIAAIEVDVASPLSTDSAKHLPAEKITDPASVSAWFRSAAKGFDEVAN